MKTAPEQGLLRADDGTRTHDLRRDSRYEVKWDRFRALASTVDGLRVLSRRRWDVTALLPELRDLPGGLIVDGELVAWDESGWPSFPALCNRMLHRSGRASVTYFVFDVLAIDGQPAMRLPFQERRRRLEDLDLEGPAWRTNHVFDDGETLFDAVWRNGLEGVVAKRLTQPYKPDERGWVKIKNRHYWRYPLEVAGGSGSGGFLALAVEPDRGFRWRSARPPAATNSATPQAHLGAYANGDCARLATPDPHGRGWRACWRQPELQVCVPLQGTPGRTHTSGGYRGRP
jgi:ATP dependent DNA ligase domain